MELTVLAGLRSRRLSSLKGGQLLGKGGVGGLADGRILSSLDGGQLLGEGELIDDRKLSSGDMGLCT